MKHINWFVCLCAANEAGETPMDIAKRLRHSQCEVLVSAVFEMESKGHMEFNTVTIY